MPSRAEAALAHAIPQLVTWNVGHMRGLSPDLTITTPKAFSAGDIVAR
jgi:hypothetical protein